MSDLDISGSIPAGPDKGSSLNASQSSVLTSVCKESLTNEDGDPVNEIGSLRKKEAKVPHSCGTANVEGKDLSPSSMFNDLYSKKDPKARVIVQTNSPVFHVFTPVSPKGCLPSSVKSPFLKENAPKFTFHSEKDIYNSEGLITIMPPLTSRFSVTAAEPNNKIEGNIMLQPDNMFKPSPSANYSYEDSYPHLAEPLQPPLYPTAASAMLNPSPPKFGFPPSNAVQEEPVPEKVIETKPEKATDEIKQMDPNIPVPPPMIEGIIPKMEDVESTAPDPTTPSAAIPVPAVSQAHAAPSKLDLDLDIGRRVHELEPIIEHRDEGAPSPGSSIQDISLAGNNIPLTEKQTS